MKLLTTLLFFLIFQFCLGQSNSYFSNGESWAGTSYNASNYGFDSFYVEQEGDTVVNNDTLIKLTKHYDFPNIHSVYYLAKNDSGILTMFRISPNYSFFIDTIVINYSRTDSITISNSFYSQYNARKIAAIDTIFLHGKQKKIFKIIDRCNQSDDDYVYEGTFNDRTSPFFDGCFEYDFDLDCFSINDSSYYVYDDSFTYNQPGACYIYNLSLDENIENPFTIYPNPFIDQITIENNNIKEPTIVQICSTNGTKIKEFVIRNKNTSLDLKELSSGVYFVNMLNSNTKKCVKIVKT